MLETSVCPASAGEAGLCRCLDADAAIGIAAPSPSSAPSIPCCWRRSMPRRRRHRRPRVDQCGARLRSRQHSMRRLRRLARTATSSRTSPSGNRSARCRRRRQARRVEAGRVSDEFFDVLGVRRSSAGRLWRPTASRADAWSRDFGLWQGAFGGARRARPQAPAGRRDRDHRGAGPEPCGPGRRCGCRSSRRSSARTSARGATSMIFESIARLKPASRFETGRARVVAIAARVAHDHRTRTGWARISFRSAPTSSAEPPRCVDRVAGRRRRRADRLREHRQPAARARRALRLTRSARRSARATCWRGAADRASCWRSPAARRGGTRGRAIRVSCASRRTACRLSAAWRSMFPRWPRRAR